MAGAVLDAGPGQVQVIGVLFRLGYKLGRCRTVEDCVGGEVRVWDLDTPSHSEGVKVSWPRQRIGG